MVRSPEPIVSVESASAPLIALPCNGNRALPFGVPLLDSVEKSPTVPNGTGYTVPVSYTHLTLPTILRV